MHMVWTPIFLKFSSGTQRFFNMVWSKTTSIQSNKTMMIAYSTGASVLTTAPYLEARELPTGYVKCKVLGTFDWWWHTLHGKALCLLLLYRVSLSPCIQLLVCLVKLLKSSHEVTLLLCLSIRHTMIK